MSRTKQILAWSGAGLLAVAGGVLWLAYDECYCDWHDNTMHIKSLSQECEAISLPQRWRYPNGDIVVVRQRHDEVTREDFEDYEFRKSPAAADQVLVALTNRPEFGWYPIPPHRTSQQRYAFHFPALAGHPESGIYGLRLASDAEWDHARVMPLRLHEMPDVERYQNLIHGSKSFDKTENHSWFDWPIRFSSDGRYLAVLSYGPRKIEGGFGFSPFRDWHRYTVDLYAVRSGDRIRRVRFWGCGGELNDAEWHGDEVFSLPLDDSAQHFIVCGFR